MAAPCNMLNWGCFEQHLISPLNFGWCNVLKKWQIKALIISWAFTYYLLLNQLSLRPDQNKQQVLGRKLWKFRIHGFRTGYWILWASKILTFHSLLIKASKENLNTGFEWIGISSLSCVTRSRDSPASFAICATDFLSEKKSSEFNNNNSNVFFIFLS